MQVAIYRCAHSIAPNIKLSVLVEQRLLDILLNDVAAPMPIHLLRLNQALDMIQVSTDLDTAATICVFTRLDNP